MSLEPLGHDRRGPVCLEKNSTKLDHLAGSEHNDWTMRHDVNLKDEHTAELMGQDILLAL